MKLCDAVFGCPGPLSVGTVGRGFHLREGARRYTHATRHPVSDLFKAGIQAATRMLGDPTTPLFSITDFISLELYQVRAFDTSATS